MRITISLFLIVHTILLIIQHFEGIFPIIQSRGTNMPPLLTNLWNYTKIVAIPLRQ